MEFKDRLKETREALGLTQKQLASKIGITPSAIQSLESGRVKSTTYLVEIAEKLKIDPEWLKTGRAGVNIFDKSQVNVSLKALPMLTIDQVTPWIEHGILPENVRKAIMSAETIEISNKGFAIEVEGDAMVSTEEPSSSLFPGDTVIIDPAEKPTSGDFVLVQYEDKGLKIRRYVKDGTEEILEPLNSRYPLFSINSKMNILGVVVFKQKRLRFRREISE